MKSVCVFCGSNFGRDPLYTETARQFGGLIARSGLTLVYGGGCVGLMGTVADGAIADGGRVIGVIPKSMMGKEVAHEGLADLRVVGSMHERKATMAELSDGFVAMPGGVGTLEEFFEIWTWSQLGLHAKPYALLNVAGFFDPLIAFLDHIVGEQFVRAKHREQLIITKTPEDCLERMKHHRPAYVKKWIDRRQT